MSTVKRPSLVWIGARPYTIEYSHDKIMIKCGEERKALLGTSNHHNLTVLIDDGVAEQTIRDTLWHEIMHLVWYDAGTGDMSMNEEEIVGTLTPRLVSMMRVNPEVMTYMLRSTDAQT
ncbi:hypothetical protein LCGC14_2111710 [marine sediment metagenome]|uniref:SprT-like domain-containing protein n=1 Tax=marine sediment metagenome TaxID=412755 RepID=A0A0F9H387_9ZZZZ